MHEEQAEAALGLRDVRPQLRTVPSEFPNGRVELLLGEVDQQRRVEPVPAVLGEEETALATSDEQAVILVLDRFDQAIEVGLTRVETVAENRRHRRVGK